MEALLSYRVARDFHAARPVSDQRHFVVHLYTLSRDTTQRWIQEKKGGWYAVRADPPMPVTSTLLDQAQNGIDRQ